MSRTGLEPTRMISHRKGSSAAGSNPTAECRLESESHPSYSPKKVLTSSVLGTAGNILTFAPYENLVRNDLHSQVIRCILGPLPRLTDSLREKIGGGSTAGLISVRL